MRRVIESIHLKFKSGQDIAKGLKEIRMPKIGETVILAGANGSGKSRTLGIVEGIANNIGPLTDGAVLAKARTTVLHNVPSLTPQVNTIASATIGTLDGARHQLLKDTSNFPANVAMALQMAQVCLTDFVDSKNPILSIDIRDQSERTTRWNNLQRAGRSILGVELGYDQHRSLTFNGERADHAFGLFSLGQRKLFSFIASLVGAPAAGDRNTIVLFDEPETHLHPQAAIQMLKAMQDVMEDGQLWIATHSIPIIAGLGIENVWYAEDGEVSYGGNQIERVLNSLMGGRENVAPLRLMLSEPDRISIARFAAECLAHPPIAPNLDRASRNSIRHWK